MIGDTRPEVDLWAPFSQDKLLEVRTSRMKTMPGLSIQSGIDKKLCDQPMTIGRLGLEGDEHDPTFHGGPDKAILGYCSSHYPGWRQSYPERVDRFVPGGFGENFVTAHMNERNVCIGDIVSVGPEVQLQVSLPRQPCFKLNHRFSIKQFAPITSKTSRTGWYYRVVREGTVRPGDEIRLVERKWSAWSIERIQKCLYHDTEDLETAQELAQIEPLGEECRGQFRKRVAKAKQKSEKAEKDKRQKWRDFRVIRRNYETPRILSLKFEAVEPSDPDADMLSTGAHGKLKLPNGLLRSYSVVAGGGEDFKMGTQFELGVALEENTRGGSRYLHHELKEGDLVQVGRFTTDVSFAGAASNHVFIAGGIGITAFLSLMAAYDRIHWNVQLHYAVRSAEDVPFRDRLDALKGSVTYYDKSLGQRMDVNAIVKNLPWNSHLYVCGPSKMMEAAKTAVEESGMSPDEVHYEAFAADTSGDPFEVEVSNRDGKLLQVGEDDTLLEVLRREFDDIPSSCEVGNCGTCKVGLKSGRVDHRGTALTPEEKQTEMLSCISRGIGRIAIEI